MSGLYLVDAMALAYRSFFALLRTNMRAPDGRPTSAVFGFAQALLRVVESRGPSHMAIARDLSGPTFRHALYPAYKAQRQPMPDDLRVQIPMVDELAEACGLPMVSLPEFEADDVMATYARLAKEAGLPVYLMTRDKDLMALVGDGIRLFDPGRGTERPEEIDPAWVKAKFGVEPSQVRDYLALVGDASDNVPGVPKVGEKTAAELLSRYPDIESIYAHLEEIGQTKKAVRRNLEEGRDLMELSRTLVTLRDDLDLPPLGDLEFRGLDLPRVKRFLTDLGMRTLVSAADKLGGSASPKPAHPDVSGLGLFESAPTDHAPAPAVNLQVVSDTDDLAFLAGILRAVDPVAMVPVPGSSKDLIGIGLSWGEGIGRYLPIGEQEGQLPPSAVRDALGDLWSDPERTWIAFDGKALRRSMERMGWRLDGVVEEVQIAAYLLAPGERHLELDRIAHFRSGRVLRRWEDLLGTARARREPESVPTEEMCGWSAAAAEALVPAWTVLREGLEKQDLSRLYSEVERPLSEVLRRMEDHGIALDRDLFAHLSTEMTSQIAALEAKASEAAGVEFNVGSPRQLGEILFDRLGLKAGRKTETGQRSTDSDTLEGLRDQHPLPGIVLEHRELAKLLGTYVDPLPTMADANGRVHTLFQQTVAATGRLSSVDPNLQNIPVRGEIGRQLRKGFVAGPGKVLVSADYSQIELRLLAHLSGDAALRAVYDAGEDIHARTAAVVHGVEPKSVTTDQRRAAKVVNFGVVYGMGPHALAAQTELSYADAKKFIEGYFSAYPGVKPYMEGILEGARTNGYVETILGRKRWIREINEKNRVFKERAEREAVNTPIQGSAADLVKLAMLAVDREIRAGRLDASMLLQVHDELVLECPVGSAPEVAARVKALMEGAMTLSVPLSVETGIGENWGTAH
ncbi:MAG TPA: DNA polymerase I [Fibrobacteria bacterium]|nr:DNA polymerase I [Fibrobacteria bacterium]